MYKQLHAWVHLFPKVERHSLGIKIEALSLELIEELFYANELPNALKKAKLHQVSAKLNLLKILIRLGLETGCLDNKKYLTLQTMLQEIGRMLGGWIRSVS